MAVRRFEYQDAKSDKFWEIERVGVSVTVRYGRTGTSGQEKTKEYADEAAATKDHDKLISQKLKKGYVETTTGAVSPAATATVATPAEAPPTPAAAQPEPQPPQPPPAPAPVKLDQLRRIDLEPCDWYLATWRQLEPLQRPEPAPFDRESCTARLGKLRSTRYGWTPDWSQVGIPLGMSREEAHFWYEVFVSMKRNDQYQLVATTPEVPITGEVTVDRVRKDISAYAHRFAGDAFLLSLVHLLSPGELITLFREPLAKHQYSGYVYLEADGFNEYVLPYLSEAEKEIMRAGLRPLITPANAAKSPPPPFRLAAALGMPAELLEVVSAWSDDTFVDTYHSVAQKVVMGLGSPELVEYQMRRLKLGLREPDDVRAWLANTEYRALDLVADQICARTNKDEAGALMEVLSLVKAPEAVVPMLRCYLDSKAPAAARDWIDDNQAHAIPGLVALAAGSGRIAEAGLEILKSFLRQGLGETISAAAACLPEATREALRTRVLEDPEVTAEPLAEADMPEWLQQGLAAAPARSKLPAWLSPENLPPILLNGRRLTAAQVSALLALLKDAELQTRLPLAQQLSTHADRGSLDRFAWQLFETWRGAGAPSKERWAFTALGHLGGDDAALRLAPQIRVWPGEAQHARAVLGLQVLRAIGSDTALMQLSGIAQKLKFKGLKKKAAELMEEIASDMGLTRPELEDRVVPDCGLDEQGRRRFDFGPRTFSFVMGPEMKPMLADESGKRRPNLPKPGQNDDQGKADAAIAAWKLIKKQIREVAKIQAARLEQAMVTGRRWRAADFQRLIVEHPLMTHIARTLLWGCFNADGTLQQAFRVTDERDLADSNDDELSLGDSRLVGVVHPLALAESERSTWGELLSDYEIIPPFAQLGRTVYSLEPVEAAKDELERFHKLSFAAPTLVFGLEKTGWVRGLPEDAGCFCEHSKPFLAAELTAVVLYEGTVSMGYIEADEELTITACYFVKGIREPQGYCSKENKLPLSRVDPIVLSEVLHDLTALAAMATS